MRVDEDVVQQVPRGARVLFVTVLGLVLLQVGALISNVLADTGGGSPSSSVQPEAASDVVAATTGAFRVDEAGAATYSVPIYAAPGTAGVTPQMALSYSSQGGDGPLGHGWSISGLSVVTRCRATREAGDFISNGVPVNGDPAPLNFTASDKFCLDGQRLVPAQSGNAACEPVSGMSSINLRTEIDSFQRVCGYTPTGGTSGPAFFTVDRKDGSSSWYGDRDNNLNSNRPDSYINSTATDHTNAAVAWAQTRFQDSTGNYIDYVYQEGAGGSAGQFQILKVRYTGKVALSGQTATSAPYAEIRFNYMTTQATPFRTTTFIAGGAINTNQQLTSITSVVDDDFNGSYTDVRHYKLTYGVGSGTTVLIGIEECNQSTTTGQVCKEPTIFDWSQDGTVSNGFFESQEGTASIPNGSLTKFEGMKFGDIDGDGRKDIVWMKNGGDSDPCPTDNINVAYARLGASGSPSLAIASSQCAPSELAWSPPDASWFLLDYDGDGRDDIFLRRPTGWVAYRGTGSYSAPFNMATNLIGGLSPAIPPGASADGEPQLADLNGDGMLDLLYPSGSGLVARIMERGGAYGFQWGAPRAIVLTTDTCSSACFTVEGLYRKDNYQQLNDFNGDARSDVIVDVDIQCSGGGGGGGGPGGGGGGGTRPAIVNPSDPTESTTQVPTETTTGALTETTTCTVGTPFVVSSISSTQVILRRFGIWNFSLQDHNNFVDVNGDGLSDIVSSNSVGGSYTINTGADFAVFDPALSSSFGSGVDGNNLQVADANGDGRADALYPSSDHTHFVARYGMASGGMTSAVDIPNAATACTDSTCLPTRSFMFGDFDGDGNTDFMRIKWSDSSSSVYYSRPSATNRFAPRNVITQITDGFGAQTKIGYEPLTNKDLYRADAGTRNLADDWGRGSPVQDLLAPLYVVSSASSTSPQSGAPTAMATLYYRYAGAKVQAGGRGLLGFREIVSIDPNESGGYVTTQTLYGQTFPFIGYPTRTIKRAVIGSTYGVPACISAAMLDGCFATPDQPFATPAGSWFSDSSQVWEGDTDITVTNADFSPGVRAPIQVRTLGTEEKLRDPVTGSQTSRVVTSFTYGGYGNVTDTTVDTFTGTSGTAMATQVTTNTYVDSTSAWRLGRLATTTVTNSRPSRAAVVRTTSFAYAMTGPATGLLTVERSNSGASANLDLRKEYTYDDYGNRTTTKVCADPATSCSSAINFHPVNLTAIQRYSTTYYGSRGRFPMASHEPFWSVGGGSDVVTQTVVKRNVFGDVTQAYDVNGRDTLAVAGNFGRPYYAWVETRPGSTPGAVGGGIDSYTRYRWCQAVGGTITCPSGARFRQEVSTEAAPSEWTYFDALGRPTLKVVQSFNEGVTDEDASAVCTDYTVNGKVRRVSNPFFIPGTATSGGGAGPSLASNICTSGRNWTTTSYDVLGRPTDVVGPDGSIVSSDYAGLQTINTDARNHSTTQVRNGKGELTQVIDANGLSMNYAYYADGSTYTVTRDAGAGSITNTFYYDAMGRKIQQSDPDSGLSSFEYNALGELIAQVDAEGNRIELHRDGRGRVWQKQAMDLGANVESTSNFEFDTADNGLGQPASDSIDGHYAAFTAPADVLDASHSFTYDALGRPLASTITIDGTAYSNMVDYDTLGRPHETRDVTGKWTKTEFNNRGMVETVCGGRSNPDNLPCVTDIYLQTLKTDAWGHVTQEKRGSSTAMVVNREYLADTGRVSEICAGTQAVDGNCSLMTERYVWDANGNLHSQQKENRYLETFTYDNLDRLSTGTLEMQDGVPVNDLLAWNVYDLLGNICAKEINGVGTSLAYTGRTGCGVTTGYGSGGTGVVGPHQVSQVLAGTLKATYTYDARGNQIFRDSMFGADRTIRYSGENQAYEIAMGDPSAPSLVTRFWYGADGARYKRTDGSKKTLYIGNVEIVIDGSTTTYKRMIAGVLLQTVVGTTKTNYYLFHDQIGNLVRITNASGVAVNNLDFSATGERQDFDGQTVGGTPPSLTTRGYTGQEHVDGTDVIHMNGRIYDPVLARFLQVDPMIQAPDNAQSWNAYTYVFNNPYRYTDPTGNLGVEERQWLAAAVAIAAAIWTGGASVGWWSLSAPEIFAIAVSAGFISGAIATQSLKGGLLGAFGGAVSGGSMLNGGAGFGEWAASTMAGGVMGTLQGGDFGHSFLSAGLTAAFMPHVGQAGNPVAGAIKGALIGGTISRLTGGKFANGAVSGAVQGALASSNRQDSPARVVDGEEISDQTGAPKDISALLSDPRTRLEGFRRTAEWAGMLVPAKQIHYENVDHFIIKGTRAAAKTDTYGTGDITLSNSAAGAGDFWIALSYLTHEYGHWQEWRFQAGIPGMDEINAYDFQARDYYFSRTPPWFQKAVNKQLKIEQMKFDCLEAGTCSGE